MTTWCEGKTDTRLKLEALDHVLVILDQVVLRPTAVIVTIADGIVTVVTTPVVGNFVIL